MKATLRSGFRSAALLAVLTFLALSIAERSATAQGPVSFGIRPAGSGTDAVPDRAYFMHTLEPGSESNDVAIVLNGGSDPVSLTLYAAEGITAINGSVAFSSAGVERDGVQSWLLAGDSQLDLAAGESVSVPFTIRVPDDAPPGDHVGGLVVEGPPKAGTSGGVEISLLERVGVAVIVRVPGPVREQLVLGTMCLNQETGSHYIEMTVGNAGNVLSNATGTLRVADGDDEELFEVPIKLGSIVPGDTTLYRADLPTALGPGEYAASAALQQSNGQELQASTSVNIPDVNTNGCLPFRDVGGAGPNAPVETVTNLVTDSDFPWLTAGLVALVLLLIAALIARELWERRRRSGA